MVLIEPYGAANEAETAQANGSSEALSEPENFWIDQHIVSNADFARFLEATGYEPQEIAPHSLQAFINQSGGFAILSADDNLRTQVGNTNWQKTSDSSPMNHTVTGQDDRKVNFIDAQTYCNWLGKVLPTAEQIEHIAMQDHNRNITDLIEFRCVRNI